MNTFPTKDVRLKGAAVKAARFLPAERRSLPVFLSFRLYKSGTVAFPFATAPLLCAFRMQGGFGAVLSRISSYSSSWEDEKARCYTRQLLDEREVVKAAIFVLLFIAKVLTCITDYTLAKFQIPS